MVNLDNECVKYPLLILALLTSTTLADTWTVDDDGKADFDNIQDAIDAASDGDEIVVMPGTYTGTGDEVVDMLGKTVTLCSSDPSDPDVVAATIINGENNKRGIVFFNGETDETIVNGLTITNCTSTEFDFDNNGSVDYWEKDGGGIYCWANPTIKNCVISFNTAVPLEGDGAGMFCRSSSPTLTNCNFNNNTGSLRGGAILLAWGANATLRNCIVEFNYSPAGGGAFYIPYSSCLIENCVIRFNSYGGIYTHSSNPSENPIITGTIGCYNEGYHVSGDYVDGGGNQWFSNCDDIDQDGDGIPNNIDNCYLYNPDQADCNNNEIGDVCDISDGISEDINSDSIPDECQCLSDVNGDGYVNVTDLLTVIDQWGLTDSPADVTADGIVNVSDLLLIISSLGTVQLKPTFPQKITGVRGEN